MVSDAPRPARARSAEEKHQRRDDILRAAERLWTTTSYADLSMNQVAREAKLAKGTLYLYFDTKEELFLALLTEHLQDWVSHTAALLAERRPHTAQQVADLLLESSQPLAPLRRLLVLLGNVLERNVRQEFTQEFNKDMSARVGRLIELLPFKPQTNQRVLRHLYALSIGWQQLSEEPATGSADAFQSGHSWFTSFEQEFDLALRAVLDRLAMEDALL